MTIIPFQRSHPDGDTLYSHDYPHVDHQCILISPTPPHNKAADEKTMRAPPPHHKLPSLIICPIGFNNLMPEGCRTPWCFFPHPSTSLSITFGAPLLEALVHTTLGLGLSVHRSWHDDGSDGGYVKRGAVVEVETWIVVTELMQHAVEVLGQQVSRDFFTGPPYQHQQRI